MKELLDGEGFILKNQVSVTESGHFDYHSCTYLLDPNPETYWDSNNIIPRFVEFTFQNAIYISAYSIKMSKLSNFITSWDVIGTLGNDIFIIHSMPINSIFQKTYQYEIFNLNHSFKVEKVKFIINTVTKEAAYISNIDFLVNEETFTKQLSLLHFSKFCPFTSLFILTFNNKAK